MYYIYFKTIKRHNNIIITSLLYIKYYLIKKPPIFLQAAYKY